MMATPSVYWLEMVLAIRGLCHEFRSAVPIAQLAADALGVAPRDFVDLEVVRRSTDARNKRRIQFEYTLHAALAVDEREVAARAPKHLRVEVCEGAAPLPHLEGVRAPAERPVIVGAGPAGLFAALVLCQHGLRPVVLEQGAPTKQRVRLLGHHSRSCPVTTLRSFDTSGHSSTNVW